MKTIIQTLAIRTLLVGMLLFGGAAIVVAPAYAAPTDDAITSAEEGVKAIGGGAANTTDLTGTFTTIINVLLFIAGAIAVVMIIFAGIQYVSSTGDPARIKKAKDTLIYSIVGLVVAILAYAIVNFVLGSLK